MPKWTPIEGHLGLYTYKTKRGVRYGARRSYADALGKRREWSTSGKMQWREADKELKKFESDLAEGKVGAISNAANITVDKYRDRMVARKIALKEWRESTLDMQNHMYTRYLQQPFGKRKMTTIKRSEYQSFLDGLASESNLAATTIKTINSAMQSIMNTAANEDVIDKNRLKGLHLGGKPARDKSLTNEQVEAWLAQAHQTLDKYELTMVLMDTLGLRRGEIMGLRNESITITRDEINQRNQAAIKLDLQRTAKVPNGGPLKTRSSYRTIWVFGTLVDYLQFSMQTADNLRARYHIQSDNHWLWLNADTGDPLHVTHLNRLEGRVSRACGIHVYPHLLRHYFSTRTIEDEKPQIDVMHYLGHKNLQMTADYTRNSRDASLNVYSSIDAFLQGTLFQ